MKSVLKIAGLAFTGFLSLAAGALTAEAQDGRQVLSERLESARKLYYNGSYYAAEKAFNELSIFLDGKEGLDLIEVEAFKVLCAISTDKVDMAGLVANFCNEYPNAPQIDKINLALASRLFDKGEYAESLKVLESIKRSHIYRNELTQFDFKTAYCRMRTGNYPEAIKTFSNIRGSSYTPYTIPSTYYLGYAYYLERNFAEAAPLFEECISDSRFALMAKYYAVESRFMLKDYDYVRSNGPALMSELERDLQANLAKILSETFYELGETDAASSYMDLYKSSGTELSRKDHYFSGILSYSTRAYQDAIASFEKVLTEDDDLSQNANYYEANSYLQLKNKVAALEHFSRAAKSDFDPVIKEDAFFNFAKLSFDVNSDISQFENYINAYPDSGKDDIINGYMAAAFLISKDYRSAVNALTKIRNHTPESAANLQKAAFFRAMQLVSSGGYRSAIPMFELSISHGSSNEDLENLAKYWLAESYFRNEQYASAMDLNSGLLESSRFRRSAEYPSAIYNQAYCYFKTGDYTAAGELFSDYISGSYRRKNYERDASLRLADTYFMKGEYSEAAMRYENLFSSSSISDDFYPAYQAALAYGLTGNDSKKITLLRQVVKDGENSPYYTQSLYELGRTCVQTGKDDVAAQCFLTLLRVESDSTYFSKSLLELAMINANNKKYDRAIEFYKQIVEKAPMSEEAQDALSGLESIYQTRNHPEQFLAYIDQIGMSSLKTADEKQFMLFSAAEQIFLSGKYSSARASLKRFVEQYPSGAYTPKATFYIAECLLHENHPEQAADNFHKVMKMDDNSLLEAATTSYAKICLDLQNYGKAAEAYDALASLVTDPDRKAAAYLGKMRAHYCDKQYSEAVKDAQMVLSSSGITKAMNREATYTIAKSYKTTGERSLAKDLFAELANDCSDAYGAESAYILIEDAYDNGDFADVELKVYAFADKGSNQLYWLAKSFIVLGDSFADREDFVQAKATFESIKKDYVPGDNDDVLEQVESRLEMLYKM